MTATAKSMDGKSCCGPKAVLPSKSEDAVAAQPPVSAGPSQKPDGAGSKDDRCCCKTGA